MKWTFNSLKRLTVPKETRLSLLRTQRSCAVFQHLVVWSSNVPFAKKVGELFPSCIFHMLRSFIFIPSSNIFPFLIWTRIMKANTSKRKSYSFLTSHRSDESFSWTKDSDESRWGKHVFLNIKCWKRERRKKFPSSKSKAAIFVSIHLYVTKWFKCSCFKTFHNLIEAQETCSIFTKQKTCVVRRLAPTG